MMIKKCSVTVCNPLRMQNGIDILTTGSAFRILFYVVWEFVPVCWVLCAKVRWPVDFVLSEIISNRRSVRKAAQLLERKINAQNVGKVL